MSLLVSLSVLRSVDAFLGRDDLDLVGQGIHMYRPVFQADVAGLIAIGQGVFQPVDVIAQRVILMGVRPAAFMAHAAATPEPPPGGAHPRCENATMSLSMSLSTASHTDNRL